MTPGTLYVVATPIGNLEDMTLRALRILKEVDLIAAEDTRHSRKLTTHFGIDTPLSACHEHNEEIRAQELVSLLRSGKSVALISDAGTPTVSDPGFRLVKRCREEGLPVASVPGACAFVAALSVAGMPCDRFEFRGFLPAKKMARRTALEDLRHAESLSIFYESPHRLADTLEDIVDVLGQGRQVGVARELTKLHEEVVRGSAEEVLGHFRERGARGELVLLIGGTKREAPEISVAEALLLAERGGELRPKEAVKQVAERFGLSSDEVYRERLRLKEAGDL